MLVAVRRSAAVAVLTFAAAVLSGPAVAVAQPGSTSVLGGGSSTSPFSPGLPQATPTTTTSSTTAATTSSSSTDSGLSGGGIAAIAVGAMLLIGGISFFIWYDARRRAPVRRRAAAAGYGGIDGRAKPGSKAKPKARKLSAAERRRRKRGRAR